MEVKCLEQCDKYTKDEIVQGVCKYAKYSRSRTTRKYTHHKYSDNKHYHYHCVLSKVSLRMRNSIIRAKDTTAIKTHFPYYSGLEELL